MKIVIMLLQLLGLVGVVANPVHAQATSSILYCCKNDNGLRVCGDRRSYCWGRETEVINSQGITQDVIGRPQTSEEKKAIAEEQKRQAELTKKRKEEEDRFNYLISLYGTPEKIDEEIERQKIENEENLRIANSRLQTAKMNVELFKQQKAGGMKDSDKRELAQYEKTVVDIQNEMRYRSEQNTKSRERLLADKKKLEDYKNARLKYDAEKQPSR